MVDYIFTTARGSTAPPYDTGVVAVIDGQIIKVTPFRATNIPPPMALHEFNVHSNATDIAVNGDASSIAVLHQQGISVFEWKNVSAPLKRVDFLPQGVRKRIALLHFPSTVQVILLCSYFL